MDQLLKKKLEKNIRRINLMNASWMFMVLMPVIIPFFEGLGLNMEEIFQVQSIFALSVLLMELPSGYISDLLGRKNSLVLASVLHGLGYSLFLYAEGFYTIAIAEVVLAVAVSFISGSDVAILYDSLNILAKDDKHIKHVGRQVFYKQVGEASAALVGGWLVAISMQAALYVHVAVSWVPLFLVFGLYEPPREKMLKMKHRDNMRYVYKMLFSDSKVLRYIVLNLITYGFATLIAVWTFQKYWQSLHIPIIYFGYLWALSNITVGIVAKNAHRIELRIGSVVTIVTIGALPIAGFLGMALVESFVGVIFALFFQASRGLTQVVLKDALNKRIGGDLRATANSVVSLGVRLIFVFVAPAVGFLIDQKDLYLTFVVLGVLYIAAFILILLPLIRLQKEFL